MSPNTAPTDSPMAAQARSHIRIEVTTPGAPDQNIDKDFGLVTVGRCEAADLQVADPSLAEFHCAVLPWQGGTVLLLDLSSSAVGTLVNGARADVAMLSSGDTVQIGGTSLVICFEAGDRAEAGGAVVAPVSQSPTPVWTPPEPDEEITEDGPVAPGSSAEPEPWTGGQGIAFEVSTGGAYVTTYQSSSETVTIGKGPAAMLQIDDSRIADLHAAVTTDESGSVQVLDLGAAGGTRVNGSEQSVQELRDGDTISIGNSTLVFRR